jgi:glycosyltransferase involved in cell wall biosynthesis
MRILVCNWRDIRHPRGGGAEVYTHQVARRWVACGHEVTLLTAAVHGLPAEEDVDGVRTVRTGSRLGVYGDVRRWYARHGRGRFDVVIDEVNTRPFLCAEWVDDAPVVALAHQVAREVWFSELAWPVAAVGRFWLEPRWLAAYRHVPVLTVSESSRRSLADYGLQRVVVVPQGLVEAPRDIEARKEATPTLAFVGRLAANKRPDHAIAAFEHVRAVLPDARLRVVGGGPLAASLERRAPDGVEFFGRVDERVKFEIMSSAHALLVTSVREGWGLVVDEAASVGTLAAAYDVDGLRDSVGAAGGRLVDPDPDALGQLLLAWLPELVGRPHPGPLPHGSRPWDEVARVVLDRIEDCIGAPRSRRSHPQPVPTPIGRDRPEPLRGTSWPSPPPTTNRPHETVPCPRAVSPVG